MVDRCGVKSRSSTNYNDFETSTAVFAWRLATELVLSNDCFRSRNHESVHAIMPRRSLEDPLTLRRAVPQPVAEHPSQHALQEEALYRIEVAELPWRFVGNSAQEVEADGELRAARDQAAIAVYHVWKLRYDDAAFQDLVADECRLLFFRIGERFEARYVMPKLKDFTPLSMGPRRSLKTLQVYPGFKGYFAFYNDAASFELRDVASRMTECQSAVRVPLLVHDRARRHTLQQFTKDFMVHRLAILAGESGCGKTHAGMSVNGPRGLTVVLMFHADFDSVSHADDERFVQHMVAAVGRALDRRDFSAVNTSDVVVFVDECGPMPNRLLMMCRLRERICATVKEDLQATHGVACPAVYLLAAGTGTDGATLADSMPDTYQYLRPAVGRQLWDAFVQSTLRGEETETLKRKRMLLDEWQTHPHLVPLLDNARAVSLLCAVCEGHLKTVDAVHLPTVSATELLACVARIFRGKNTLRSLDLPQLEAVSAAAVRLALCTDLARPIREDFRRRLCSCWGLVEDRARWFLADTKPSGWCDIETTTTPEGVKLHLCHPPREPRYEMSSASAMMILSRFGLECPAASDDVSGFEKVFHLKMRLCLQTAVSVGEVYQMLALPEGLCRAKIAADQFLTNTHVHDEVLSRYFASRSTVDSEGSKKCANTFGRFRAAIAHKYAVNAINAPGASFADNIVVTTGLLILGRTRAHAHDHLTSQRVKAEVANVFGDKGNRARKLLARITPDKPILIIMGSDVDEDARSDRDDVVVAKASDPRGVLAPLLVADGARKRAAVFRRFNAAVEPQPVLM